MELICIGRSVGPSLFIRGFWECDYCGTHVRILLIMWYHALLRSGSVIFVQHYLLPATFGDHFGQGS